VNESSAGFIALDQSFKLEQLLSACATAGVCPVAFGCEIQQSSSGKGILAKPKAGSLASI